MNILLLGSGGREHALAWKIANSPLVTSFYCAPGNAGIAKEAECLPVDLTDHAAGNALSNEDSVHVSILPETHRNMLLQLQGKRCRNPKRRDCSQQPNGATATS